MLKIASGVLLGLTLFAVVVIGLLTFAEQQRVDALRVQVTRDAKEAEGLRGVRQAGATRDALYAAATRAALERCRAEGGFMVERSGATICVPPPSSRI